MDLHTPEHPILTVKDFFVQMFTVTIGLLIALGLESTVEWVHHNNQLGEARRQLAEEKRNNITLYHADCKSFDEGEAAIHLYLNDLRHSIQTNTTPAAAYDIDPGATDLNLAVWKTADRSGALILMPPAEVTYFDELYANFAKMNDGVQKTYLAVDKARGVFLADPDPHHLTHDQQVALYNNISEILSDLYELKMIEKHIEGNHSEFR